MGFYLDSIIPTFHEVEGLRDEIADLEEENARLREQVRLAEIMLAGMDPDEPVPFMPVVDPEERRRHERVASDGRDCMIYSHPVVTS